MTDAEDGDATNFMINLGYTPESSLEVFLNVNDILWTMPLMSVSLSVKANAGR